MYNFIETKLFTQLVQEYLSDGEYAEMNEKNRNIGQEILSGLQEIKRGEHGRIITIPDIAQTRAKVGLSQTQFAQLMGVSVRTLQDWEQGRRRPSGAARTLLMVADKNPQAILDVM